MGIRDQEIAIIHKYIKGNVVDVGSGGDKRYSPSIGIDKFAFGKVREHPEQGNSTADMQWDIHTLPFKDETIDTILSFHSIEHLQHPKEALTEWLRCLKPGGYLCLIIPDRDYTEGKDSTHFIEWTPSEFMKFVDGYNIVQFNSMKNNWSFDCVIQK